VAISINWDTKVIFVPRADIPLVQSTPTEIRQLDINDFRLELKDLEDSVEGMPNLDTHQHNTTVEVGGVTLARVVEIINGYTVTFENGAYQVNLAGANSNIADVTNLNQVGVRSANSAGLQDISGFQERLDYAGAIWLDTVNGAPATKIEHPWGTPAQPVDNFSDAAALAAAYSIYEIRFFAGGITTPVTIDVDVSNLNIVPTTSGQSIYLDTGNIVNGTRFERTYLNGTAGGTLPFYGDYLGFYGGFRNLRGIFTNSLLLPDPNGLDNRVFLGDDFSCVELASGVPGADPAELCNFLAAADTRIQILGFTGGLEIHNTQAGDILNIDFRSGYLRLNPTVTGGDYAVRGVIAPIDNQGTPDSLDITGLITSEEAEFASYADSSVWVNTASGNTNTIYPAGTSRDPVSTSTAAQTIADAKGLTTIRLTDNLTLDVGPDHSNMLFQGRSPRTTQLTIPVGATVTGAEYRNMLLSGPLAGGTYLTSCAVKGIDNVSGHLEQCVIREVGASGYTIRGAGGGGILMINRCTSVWAQDPGQQIPVIDLNGDTSMAMRAFSGEVLIKNKTDPTKAITIDLNSGRVILDSTITAGNIYVRGNGVLEDNTTGTAVVINDLVDDRVTDLSFYGRVWVDPANGSAGQGFPLGTAKMPVDNLSDAIAIATENNIKAFGVLSDLTIDPSITLTGRRFIGLSAESTVVTVDAAATLNECVFENLYLSGVLDNESVVRDSTIEDLEIRNGRVERCILKGTTTLAASAAQIASFIDCYSGVPGTGTPIIDCGGSAGGLSVRGYNGGLTLRNKTGSENMSVDLASGQLILEATVTGGTVVARGVGKLLDSSVGATIIDELLDARRVTLIEKIQRNRLETDPDTGVLTIYDDDSVTPLVTANIFEDVAASQAYQGQGVQRRDRLT
jgi:hypothetical protein